MTAKHVGSAYRHVAKHVTPRNGLALRGSRLKWYNLAKSDAPVDAVIQTLAARFLEAEAEKANWPLDTDVGFLILHRCAGNFHFLIFCTWRGDNEIWQTVYFKPDDQTPDFALFPQGSHKGTFCVWEAGIVRHEVDAWSRFLRSDRGETALEIYMSDCASGEVV